MTGDGVPRSVAPPCRRLGISCLTCPLACCLEELPSSANGGGGRLTAELFNHEAYRKRAIYGRQYAVEFINAWWYRRVLPMAKAAIEHPTREFTRGRAEIIVRILEETARERGRV